MTSKEAPNFNVFISYAPNDGPLLKELETHISILVEQGLITCWHDQKIGGGLEEAKEIERYIASAAIILLLISSDFFACEPCQTQMKQALKRQVKNEVRLVPILLRPSDWINTELKVLQALPFNQKPVTSWPQRDEAFLDIVQGIHQVIDDLKVQRTLRPASSFPIENIPYERNLYFTGREELLDRIYKALHNEKSATPTQAISGLGGIGKTQTALEYAYRYQEYYQTILWLKADSREQILTDINAIAQLLSLPARPEQEQSILFTAFRRWLQENQDWLLILDNVDDLNVIKDLLPRRGQGHILITTRIHTTGTIAQRIEIEKMNMQEGAHFLLRRVKILDLDQPFEQASEQDRQRAREIAKLMDGLPLALDQAAAYIDETQCGLDGYIALFQKRQTKLLERRGKNVLDHPDPVATTWSLSFENVQRANPMAVDLLYLCAFLDPDSIPEELFAEGGSELGPVLSTIEEDPLAFNDAISELLNYSLIQRNPDHTLIIHRLVQIMLKNAMDQETQRLWAERAVLATNDLFPSTEFEFWPRCFALLPQAKNGAVLIAQWEMKTLKAARLLNQLGLFIYEQSEYKEVEPLLEGALEIYREVLGEEHPAIATSLNNLAVLYESQGRYEEAEPLYERGLEIRRKVSGEEHPDTAGSLNNLAAFYASQGRYEEAEPLYKRGLEIRRKLLGEEHPDTAGSLNNLAMLYESQGRYEEAEPLYKQGLEISRKVLGKEHPTTLMILANYQSFQKAREEKRKG